MSWCGHMITAHGRTGKSGSLDTYQRRITVITCIYRTKNQTHKMEKICLLKISIKLNNYK